MPWDPFLMKKLLKSGICGSVNSAPPWKSQQMRAKKKGKMWKKQNVDVISWIQTGIKWKILPWVPK